MGAGVYLLRFPLYILAGLPSKFSIVRHIATPCRIVVFLFFIWVIIVAGVRDGELAHGFLLQVHVVRTVGPPDILTQDTP